MGRSTHMAAKQLHIRVYRWGIHRGEESLIAGNDRSGVFYLSGCHLKCSFCYTPETSIQRLGIDLEPSQVEGLYETLLARGAKNINLISPTHYWSRLESTLQNFKANHSEPVILKISGYESLPLIKRMASVADVFVPDFKVWNSETGVKYQLPKDYGVKTLAALEELQALYPENQYTQGKLTQGFLVRHLIMPHEMDNSFEVVEKLAEINFKGVLNLMTGFLSPTQGLVSSPADKVNQLVALAESSGMTVLRNGVECERKSQKNLL